MRRKLHGLKSKPVPYGQIVLELFLIVFIYAILNIWAIHQIKLDTSTGSLATAITDYKLSSSLTEGNVGTTIRLQNPTIIPVLVGNLNYDANYGDTQLAHSQSGFIFIMPYSTINVPINLKVYYGNIAKGLISGIANALVGKSETLSVNLYTHLLFVDIPLKTYSLQSFAGSTKNAAENSIAKQQTNQRGSTASNAVEAGRQVGCNTLCTAWTAEGCQAGTASYTQVAQKCSTTGTALTESDLQTICSCKPWTGNKQILTLIAIADYAVGCTADTGVANNITLKIFNMGGTNIDVNRVVINGNTFDISPTIAIHAGSIGSIFVSSATTYIPGLSKTTTKSADILISSVQGYIAKSMTIDGRRCNS